MNSVQLANLCWGKLKNYSVIQDFHLEDIVRKENIEEETWVRVNALRRLKNRVKEWKEVNKKIKDLNYKDDGVKVKEFDILMEKLNILNGDIVK
jgi:hypothetical protein